MVTLPVLLAIIFGAVILGLIVYNRDDASEERRRSYLKVADVLRDEFGLSDIPDFMDDLALKDLDRAFFKVKKLADDFQHVDKVKFLVDKAFNKIFDAALKDPVKVQLIRDRLPPVTPGA